MPPLTPDAGRIAARPLLAHVGRALAIVSLIGLTGFWPLRAQTPATSANPTPAPPRGIAAINAEAEGAPALNWVLPIFTDKEGYRSMTLRGSEVRPFQGGVTVTDLSITIFNGAAIPVVDSMLLSPAARFMLKQNRAEGDKSVRFIRDDIEVTGVGWIYDHAARKISLQQNVRVTFSAQLNDILK